MIPAYFYVQNLLLLEKFKKIHGDIVECGVWKGGMIAGIAQLFSDEREYYLYDSFMGLPTALEIDGAKAQLWQKDIESDYYYNNCGADKHFAEQAMSLSGINKYHIIEGWFDTTLFYHPDSPIAVLRLDADWYTSTMTCLDTLYKNVVVGGIIIIDDYYTWEGCSKAIHDFLSEHKLVDRIRQYNNHISYIVKN